jgi:hypoxanthine phosphoribosyltransferase
MTPTTVAPKTLATPEQIQRRVQEMGRKISEDYAGRTIYALGVLENAFIFMADLVRAIEVPVVCQFIRPHMMEVHQNGSREIFFGPEFDVAGRHVLLIEGLVNSGQTTDFLLRNIVSRGAASVKLAAMLDKQTGRTVHLQPDYFGFLVNDYAVGYGLGAPDLDRNLPYIAARAMRIEPAV